MCLFPFFLWNNEKNTKFEYIQMNEILSSFILSDIMFWIEYNLNESIFYIPYSVYVYNKQIEQIKWF